MTTGAFRFVTGHSDKNAYKITTPLATIGVRGTTLDILSQRGRSVVVLQDGAARVCTTSFQCIELTQPGDTAVITSADGKISIHEDQHAALDFRRELRGRGGPVQHHTICRRLADDHAGRGRRSHRHAVRALTMAGFSRSASSVRHHAGGGGVVFAAR